MRPKHVAAGVSRQISSELDREPRSGGSRIVLRLALPPLRGSRFVSFTNLLAHAGSYVLPPLSRRVELLGAHRRETTSKNHWPTGGFTVQKTSLTALDAAVTAASPPLCCLMNNSTASDNVATVADQQNDYRANTLSA